MAAPYTVFGGRLPALFRNASQFRDGVQTQSNGGSYVDIRDFPLNQFPRGWCEVQEDFLASTLALPNVLRDTSAAGTPTSAQATNAVGGQWTLTQDNTSEAQRVGIDWGDDLMLNGAQFYFEVRVSIPVAITTAQFLLLGVSTAYNSTVASMTRYAWHRLTASMNVLAELDDDTNSNLAQSPDTGIAFALTAATFYNFWIDATIPGVIEYGVNDSVLVKKNHVLTGAMQPMMLLGKSTGVTTPAFTIDSYRALWARL